jgi:hypothetical protein
VVHQDGCKPALLRGDDAKTLTSVELKDWLRKKYSVEIEPSIPYAHWENAATWLLVSRCVGVATWARVATS